MAGINTPNGQIRTVRGSDLLITGIDLSGELAGMLASMQPRIAVHYIDGNEVDGSELLAACGGDDRHGEIEVPEVVVVAAPLLDTTTLGWMRRIVANTRLPVVAVDATGTRDEISHEQEGLLTENDSQALAQAIERVLADQDLYQKLRAAAEQKAQTLEATVQAKKLVTVYEQAITDKKADRVVPVEAYQPMFELVKNQWRQITGGEKKAET